MKYKSEDPEIQEFVDEEDQNWWDGVVAAQKDALQRLRGGQMSSMVPDADDTARRPVNLTRFEVALLLVCIDKQVEHLNDCIRTYKIMLSEDPPEDSDEEDVECIDLFSKLCKKDVENLIALRFECALKGE